MFEIAVIGAGVAGLTCARKLQQAGRRVVVFDKSRGLGGRLATRRLAGTHADHGVCYLQPKGAAFGQKLLASIAPFAIGLNSPEILQVHRWGYAFAQNPLPDLFLTAQSKAPLYFCGDWCGGNRVESAFLSGSAVAEKILDV